MRLPVGLHPGRLEGGGLDEPGDLRLDEVVDRVGQGGRQRLEAGRRERRQPGLAQPVQRLLGHRLDLEAGHDLGGDLVDDGGLHGRIIGQGSDRLDVPVGVGDLAVGPLSDHCQRRQDRHHQDQHGRDDRAPPPGLPPLLDGQGNRGFRAGQLGAQLLHLGPEAVDLRVGLLGTHAEAFRRERSWRAAIVASSPARISQTPTKTTRTCREMSV